MATSTSQANLSVSNSELTPIVTVNNAPNSPCEVIVQNSNGNGYVLFLGNSNMFNEEAFGLKLEDGMALSIALGPSDELYAFGSDTFNINVLKTSGIRR